MTCWYKEGYDIPDYATEPSGYVPVDYNGILHMTEKAVLLDIGNKESVWIPKSQLKCKGRMLSSNGGVVLIVERFASKKGLLQW